MENKCSIESCSRNKYVKSYCRMHYDRNRKHGNPNFEYVIRANKCGATDCNIMIRNKYCTRHQQQLKRTGKLGNIKTLERHGQLHTREYHCWSNMKSRCTNAVRYPRYAKKGIKVCDRWNNSFVNFLEDMGKCPDGMSLDRKNNLGNYEPSNCRWASASIQMINQEMKSNNTSGYRGVHKNGKNWSAEIAVNKRTIHLGTYINKEDAALAYNEAAIIHHGTDAKLNVLPIEKT